MPRSSSIPHCNLCGAVRESIVLPSLLVFLICPHCDYVCARGPSCLSCRTVSQVRFKGLPG